MDRRGGDSEVSFGLRKSSFIPVCSPQIAPVLRIHDSSKSLYSEELLITKEFPICKKGIKMSNN